MIEMLRDWWMSLKESTRKSIKTLWETAFGTFVVVFAGGLVGGLVSVDALKALVIAALSAAIAAVAAKLVNMGKDIIPMDAKVGGTDE